MRPLDYGAALTVIVIWALNFSVAKVGVEQLPPLFMLLLRFALLAVLMLPFVRLPEGQSIRPVIGAAAMLGGLHFGLLFVGLAGVGAAPAAIAVQLAVPFSAILARVFFKEKLNGWQIAGMAVAFFGVAFLGGSPENGASIPHLLMVVGAAYAWAQANVFLRRLGGVSPFTLNAWVALFAVPQLALASFLLEGGQAEALRAADWRGYGAVLFMVFGASIVAYGLWYNLLGRHPINRVVPLTLLAPVLAVLLAVVILDEPLTLHLATGGLVTIAGVAMIEFLRDPALKPGVGA